jgi:hypothetical protein
MSPCNGEVGVAGSRVRFETYIDSDGEIWINGRIDRSTGVVNINAQQRGEVSASAVSGARHVRACRVASGPLAGRRGGISMRDDPHL